MEKCFFISALTETRSVGRPHTHTMNRDHRMHVSWLHNLHTHTNAFMVMCALSKSCVTCPKRNFRRAGTMFEGMNWPFTEVYEKKTCAFSQAQGYIFSSPRFLSVCVCFCVWCWWPISAAIILGMYGVSHRHCLYASARGIQITRSEFPA